MGCCFYLFEIENNSKKIFVTNLLYNFTKTYNIFIENIIIFRYIHYKRLCAFLSKTMDYKETLDYISSINWKGSVLGLERINLLMEKLGNPQKELKFIHIAGTNGKGSTAAFLSSVLVKAGYKTGLFTSPYIEVFNERMQINNENISDEELAEITSYIRPFADSMEDKPTEFELNTAISLVYFAKNKCDIVVFEVGMGGSLDSTNVIDTPEVAVITAIGLDHTEELGDTIEKIAYTKSGIIKEGTSVVVYDQAESVKEVIKNRCNEVNAKMYVSEPSSVVYKSVDIDALHFSYKEFDELTIPLIGNYQLLNVAVALKVIEVLKELGWNISNDQIIDGLKNTKWPGRFEVLKKDPVFIVDGAHNPHGIKATSQSIKAVFDEQLKKGEKLSFIFGVMVDKDYMDMLSQIIPMAKEFYCVTPDNPRAFQANELANIIEKMGVKAEAFESIDKAIDSALSCGNNCIALGSLYMIGDIKKYIKNKN